MQPQALHQWKIAVVGGGSGSEADISRLTAKSFRNALLELKIDHDYFEYDGQLVSLLQTYKPSHILNALHGKGGEDGVLQGLCEYLDIPYTGSGIYSSSLAFDKIRSKQKFKELEVPTPQCLYVSNQTKKQSGKTDHYFEKTQNESELLKQWEKLQVETDFKLPCVIKPSREGSSSGVSLCFDIKDVPKALKTAFHYDDEVLVEQYIKGFDLTVPVLNLKASAPILIKPKSGFYDFENKYTKGRTDYLLPAPIPPETLNQAQYYSEVLARGFEMKGLSRIDFMYESDTHKLYAIEVNTLPGMTPLSLAPMSLAFEGMDFNELVLEILRASISC